MNFKRLGAGVLAAALAATSTAIYAYAEEDAAMKQALTYVKQRLDIPEDYTEFNHSTSTQQGKTRYYFSWTKKAGYDDDDAGGSMSVSITGKVINSVNIYEDKYNEDDWKASFAKLSDEKLLAAAKKYIKQINPTIYDSIEVSNEISISLWGPEAYLGFKRVVNGVEVTGQSGTVTINKNTGKLVRYTNNWINGATFSDTKNALSVTDAQKAYKKLFPVEKVYTIQYDWEENKYIPHLIYRQTAFGQINAFTGDLSTFEDYKSYDDNLGIGDDDADMVANEAADVNPGAGAREVTFTEAEIEKLEKENSLIKAEDALANLQKLGYFYIPKESEVYSQYCYYNENENYYERNVSFKGRTERYVDLNGGVVVPLENMTKNNEYSFYGSFTINAETGDLLSFSCSAPDIGQNLDKKTYDKRANEVLQKILGSSLKKDFGTIENTWASKVYSKYDPNTGAAIGEPRITMLSYGANRVAYGITCINENVSLSFGNNGYVTNFRLNYNKNIDYPKPEKIISANKAYSQFFKQVELGLRYRCAYNNDEKKVVSALVYATNNNLYIDAFTGKLTNSSGKEITEAQKAGDYTDLENSKYKKYAEKLQRYGITLMDGNGKLNENQTITALDFSNVMSSAGINVNAKEKDKNIIKEDTKITRQLAAYLLVGGKYGSQIADMTSIFKSKFSDVKNGSKYVGYIMIADASGLLKGNGGKYSPKAALTRGATLKLIYDYLSK